MINKTVFTELWRRVLEREELGLYIQFDDVAMRGPEVHLQRARPPEAKGYTIARTPDPTIFFIVRPGVNIHADSDRHALQQVFSDISSEPLP